MRTFLPALLLSMFAAGCARTLSVDLPPQTLTVVGYSQGKASERCSVSPKSDKFRKLGELLKQNAGGWHSRKADYTPDIVVIGNDVNLYFTDDALITTYGNGEFSHPITPDAYSFLRCTAK